MERLKRVTPEEMPEILRLASELHAQDQAQIERAQECEQIAAAAAELGLPPEYLERAAAALEARRRPSLRPRRAQRGLLAPMGLALVLCVGVGTIFLRPVPSTPLPTEVAVQSHAGRNLIQAPCPPDFHGLPADQFQNCFNYWVRQGLWPVTLSATQQSGQFVMSGSFQPGADRPVRHLITAQQYEQEVVTFRGRGYRPAHVNILNTAAGLRFTAIWTPTDGPFESWWGMTPEAYDARWHQLRSQGYLQTDLFAYQDNGLKFAATWVKKPFSDYASYCGMTSEQYDARCAAFWGQGLRVTHFIAYSTGADMRYAAIWEKRPGGWAHYYGMTWSEYQQKYDTLAAQGHRIYQIHAYGDRYSAVWYRL